jgi:hypothetical protein
MGDFDPAEAEDQATRTQGARDAANAASESVKDTVIKQLEAGSDADFKTTIQQLGDLNSGKAVSNPTEATKTYIKGIQDNLESLRGVLEAAGGDVDALKNAVGTADIKDTFDSTKNPKNAGLLSNISEWFQKKFKLKTDEDIEKIAKNAKENADKEPNPVKRSKWKRNAAIFGALTIAGLTIAGLIELFQNLAAEKSGCYQMHVGSSDEDIKLDCGDMPLDNSNCNCNSDTIFTGLSKSCTAGGSDISKDTCPPGDYRYLFRHYSAWDIFTDFVNTVADDIGKIPDFFGQIADFFGKYGFGIVMAIICIVILMVLGPVLRSLGK